MSKPDQRLTNIFKNQTKRICSLEFSSKKEINYELVDTIPFSFCSVIWIGTYDKPAEEIEPLVAAAELIKRGHPTVLHIAARNVNKKTIPKILEHARQIGVRNLLVMRGDYLPKAYFTNGIRYNEEFHQLECGSLAAPGCQEPDSTYDFPYSTDLIKFIKAKYGDYFDLCVPGYPYKHPESRTLEEDMKYLKQKNDAGAKFIISQAAFSYEIYKNFLKNCRKFEITMQIIPGVYMIRSVVDFCLLKKLCKVPTNDPVVQFIKEHKGAEDEIAAYGVKISNEVVKKILQDRDFCPPHIYTMNEFATIKEFVLNLKSGDRTES